MSKHVLIIGGGVIGLCTAYYTAQCGHRVTVVDCASESELGCSYGNAGMITPSHFVPLAAPGAIRLALKWMWNSESPFYMKPRFDSRRSRSDAGLVSSRAEGDSTAGRGGRDCVHLGLSLDPGSCRGFDQLHSATTHPGVWTIRPGRPDVHHSWRSAIRVVAQGT